MKKILFKQQTLQRHWVGDGFPVRTIFSYHDLGKEISPFLLMDYGGPETFPPNDQHPKGVGEHPHRGFETVTLVYEGEVEHRDSEGGGGLIGPGDVQWMTAASGLVHEEKHGAEFSKSGGLFEMIQLWVNLPAKDKMAQPRYQGLKKDQIPTIEIADGRGSLRVIAGEFADKQGPAKTFTPINLWDLRLQAGASVHLQVPTLHTAAFFVLSGSVELGTGELLGNGELAVLEPAGESVALKAVSEAKILFLGGEPIDEPIIGYGPFVMNSMDEIQQAFVDFQAGKMGKLPRAASDF